MVNLMQFMKTLIKPYTKSLLKQNTPYIIICIIFVLLSIIGPFLVFNKFTENSQNLQKIEEEIKVLNARKTLLESIPAQSMNNPDQDIRILNSLIPDAEDYFSIIESLDALSQASGFEITSYTISTKNLVPDKLPLLITGVGDGEAFINFLKVYNFAGNRLITLDRVEYKPTPKESTYALSINFYHKGDATNKPGEVNKNVNYQASFKRLNELKEKINISFTKEDSQIIESYPVKSNPF